jgi:hypothetical protein
MQTVSHISGAYRLLATLVLGAVIASCGLTDPDIQQLRIRNVGFGSVGGLKVGFPDTTIAYGDIMAGVTTDYIDVPGGVYGYSAFRFQYDGSERIQPVIDFVGESPMDGKRFTYDIELSLTPNGPYILIKDVTRDP